MSIFKSADILIPKQGTDFGKWSVVACDQYTSEPEYWSDVASIAGDAPSAVNIVFPEAYLNDGKGDERIERINSTMEEYVNGGIFETLPNSYVYVERTQSDGKVRRGIVGAVDLEEYDYSKGSVSAVRATEGTILSRIPPRKKIRRNALLELPHIMLLVDDKEKKLIEPLADITKNLRKLYDFKLMKNSGSIKGWVLNGEPKKKLDALLAEIEASKKAADGTLVFAVGDGNHSLATAKACWEELKPTLTEDEKKNHPARFALAELVNLYDDALEFEAIHRIVFGVNPQNMLDAMAEYYKDLSFDKDNGGQRIDYVFKDKKGSVYVNNAPTNLPVGTLQKFIDAYLEENGGEVDYIHGAEVISKLASEDNAIGFIVDAIDKNDLYPTVIKDGALPRKTFSMGEAADKRFYLEAKKIR